jgi:segregation and condensation protein A
MVAERAGASETALDLIEERAASDPELVVDVGGFEGPLDLLLLLARQQKVDLHHISILALADQYLAFIESAKKLRLELAADYLLMAAWLAYLKSRLLLPEATKDDEPTGEELAEVLAERLRRLQTIRLAGERLLARPRLGRDVFARGFDDTPQKHVTSRWSGELIDLLKAYAGQRARHALARVTLHQRKVWSLGEARVALERLIGIAGEWTRLDAFLLDYLVDPSMRATIVASGFASSLELVREGLLDLRQDGPFGPLYARRRSDPEPTDG